MQDQDRGHLIDDFLVFLAGVARFVEELMGFARGEALVPEVDAKTSELAQFGGELLRFDGARARFARKLERVAYHDAGNGVAAGKPGDGTQVVAAVAMNFEGENGLGGEAELVGNGNADALCADI